ncbi:MAG: ATP-binding protein [Rhodospirillaceae bacterium]
MFSGADKTPRKWAKSCAALLASRLSREALTTALLQPWAAVIEVGDGDNAEIAAGDWTAVLTPDGGFYLSVTTSSAFGLQVAQLVTGALVSRAVLLPERRSVVELCLQEVVANAIIHGNLGIPSTAKDHPEGYRVFSQQVNNRLADPQLRLRRVDLFVRWSGAVLDISVLDQGAGFDANTVPTVVEGTSRSGRGFVFMRALARDVRVSDGGRCTSLRFAL